MKKHISTIRIDELNLIRLFKENKETGTTPNMSFISIDHEWIKNEDISKIDEDFLDSSNLESAVCSATA